MQGTSELFFEVSSSGSWSGRRQREMSLHFRRHSSFKLQSGWGNLLQVVNDMSVNRRSVMLTELCCFFWKTFHRLPRRLRARWRVQVRWSSASTCLRWCWRIFPPKTSPWHMQTDHQNIGRPPTRPCHLSAKWSCSSRWRVSDSTDIW